MTEIKKETEISIGKDFIVESGGILNVSDDGKVDTVVVQRGGRLTLGFGAEGKNLTVCAGGELYLCPGAFVEGLHTEEASVMSLLVNPTDIEDYWDNVIMQNMLSDMEDEQEEGKEVKPY